MKLGITALALFVVLLAVTAGVGVLAFGQAIHDMLQTLQRITQ